MRIVTFYIIIQISFLAFDSKAQVRIDTLYRPSQQLQTNSLESGNHQYLVYFKESKTGNVKWVSVWNRNIEFKTIKGRKTIEVIQDWHSDSKLFQRHVYSLIDANSFIPIHHKSIRGGKDVTDAFDFHDRTIKGSDSISNNRKTDFVQSKNTYTLNWELDLETLESLKYREGKAYAINFYHPGSKTPPMFYTYYVTGSEKIKLIDGNFANCWKVQIDYSEENNGVFWISKKTNKILKMEEIYDGTFKYKIRLGTHID